MAKIAIVTDSVANLPSELVERYDIHVVPNLLVLCGQTFRDGVDITTQEFYRRLREGRHLPTTSAPSVGDFLRVYAKLSQEAEAIISIHIAPELSATFSTAQMASELIEGIPIHVVDARTAAAGQGLVALEAARAAAEGQSLAEVLHRIENVIPKVDLLVTLDTLEYLHRGGRVPAVAALVGSVLQVKPIIYLKNGVTSVLEKPRTRAKAVRRVLEIVEDRVGASPVHVAVMHAEALREAEGLRDEIASRFNCLELFITGFTPVMGAHTGPGVLGMAFWAER